MLPAHAAFRGLAWTCDHPRVGEYGNGLANGPAGQVAGNSGGHALGAGGDPFANLEHAVNDGVAWVGSLSPVELAVLVVAVVIGLILVRRLLF